MAHLATSTEAQATGHPIWEAAVRWCGGYRRKCPSRSKA